MIYNVKYVLKIKLHLLKNIHYKIQRREELHNSKFMQRENMAVSKKDVEYVAELARLSFTEEEKESLAHDLNSVLGYIDKLNELDTDNVNIIVNPYYIENKFREDVVEPSMDLKDVIKNSPKNLEEYIIVPKIIE